MSYIECARIAERHPDLAGAVQKIVSKLQEMGTAEVIRPADLASFLSIDPNQVLAVLDELALTGYLRVEDMVECIHCGVPVLRSEYDEAYEEDGEYRCTCCDRPLGSRTIQAITTYRRGEKWPDISGGSESPELGEAAPPSPPPPMTIREDAFYTPNQLADIYGIRSKDALRMRLKRYRDQNLNGGWKDNKDRRPRESPYLYQLKDVKPILIELQASGQRSGK